MYQHVMMPYTLDEDSFSEQNTDEAHFEEPEDIMDTLFNAMHSARKIPMMDQSNLISSLENDPTQFSEVTRRICPKLLENILMVNLTAVSVSTFFQNETKFKGACADIRAQKSVIGFPQAKECSLITENKIKSPKSTVALRFGDGPFH